MSCNPSSSQATVSTHAAPPMPGKRYSIHVEADGTVGGRDSSKWSSRCGVLIRALVPISYKDWRRVDKTYKNDMWIALMKEFEMNLEPHVARPLLERKYSQFFRTEKHNLRKKFIRTATNKFDAIANCPDDIDKIWWETFVDNEWEEKKIEQCKKNAENRSLNTINHALGRRSYSQLYETMEKTNPETKFKRSCGRKAAHARKNGDVLPSAQEKYKLIVAEEEKTKAASTSEHGSATSIDDIEHDELAEIFGPDKNNRCRAMSSSSSMKQVKYGQATKAIAEEKCDAKFEKWHAKMKATVKSTVLESMKEFATMYFGMQPFSNPEPQGSTPRTEGSSNFNQNQVPPQNLNNAFDAISTHMPSSKDGATSHNAKQYVMLLSREQTEVAKGYITKHNGVCHMRTVAPDERVVWVTEVKEPEARIYEAPQNGHYKFCEIADGGFLIWLQTRLRYM